MRKNAILCGLTALVAWGLAACRLMPEVDWDETQCQIGSNTLEAEGGATPAWQACRGVFFSQPTFDQFELNLTAPDMDFDDEMTLYLIGDWGTIAPGRYEVVGGLYDLEDETRQPRQAYANFSGAVVVEEFEFKTVGGGPLGLGVLDLGTTTGTFSIRLSLEPGSGRSFAGSLEPGAGRSFAGSLEASGENLPVGSPLFPGLPGSSLDPCLVGTWDAPPGCNGESNTLYFHDGGTGRIETVDCAGLCAKNQNYFDFDWRVESEGQLTVTYGMGATCNQTNGSAQGQTGTTPYTCSGSSLSYDNLTWTKQ